MRKETTMNETLPSTESARTPEKKSAELDLAVRLAAGLLSGPNISHRDIQEVARLAVAHARALIEAVDADNA